MRKRNRDERGTRTPSPVAPSDARDQAVPRVPPANPEGRVKSGGGSSGTDDEHRDEAAEKSTGSPGLRGRTRSS